MKNNLVYKTLKKIYNVFLIVIFFTKFYKYKKLKKIIYCLTPSSNLSNVGDQAQSVAINKWLKGNFKGLPVLEFTKDEVYRYIESIKQVANSRDLIFLHSGGNLGDRGLWSEGARRLIIKNFPENKIISLPQTIFFSDTKRGQDELDISKRIYNRHRNLTIIARDEGSFGLAREYFPNCRLMILPDFVLSLKSEQEALKRQDVLLCLRQDNESAIDKNDENCIISSIEATGFKHTKYDTTLNRKIPKLFREKELIGALNLFRSHKLVITDRFHGIIFSVITKTPCIALKTVDHKLTESAKWFGNLNFVFYARDYNELRSLIEKARSVSPIESIDWENEYFKNLKDKL